MSIIELYLLQYYRINVWSKTYLAIFRPKTYLTIKLTLGHEGSSMINHIWLIATTKLSWSTHINSKF